MNTPLITILARLFQFTTFHPITQVHSSYYHPFEASLIKSSFFILHHHKPSGSSLVPIECHLHVPISYVSLIIDTIWQEVRSGSSFCRFCSLLYLRSPSVLMPSLASSLPSSSAHFLPSVCRQNFTSPHYTKQQFLLF